MDGCNWFGGPYSVGANGAIHFDGLASTAVGCSPLVLHFASAYQGVFARTVSYKVAGETLTLYDASGGALVVFGSHVPAPITGLVWVVGGYRSGPFDNKQAIIGVKGGSPVTTRFGADGTMIGNAGCITYAARFTESGSGFALGTVQVDTAGCARGSRVHRMDGFVAALGQVTSWKFSGPSFQLLDATGTVQALFYQQATPGSG
jgi:heat shock protein HslJ